MNKNLTKDGKHPPNIYNFPTMDSAITYTMELLRTKSQFAVIHDGVNWVVTVMGPQ